MKLPIKFRPPSTQDDISFIYNAWLRSYRDSPFAKTLTNDVYYATQKETVTQLINHCQVTMASLDGDDDCLFGFICHGQTPNGLTTVHYLYVKWRYRKAGVGQALFNHIQPTTPTICSNVTDKFFTLRAQHRLPLVTLREYEDLKKAHPTDTINHFQEWFESTITFHTKGNNDQRRNDNSVQSTMHGHGQSNLPSTDRRSSHAQSRQRSQPEIFRSPKRRNGKEK